ncbi:MAG: hypothetical protein ACI9TP_002364 [Candidatus Azotimanducaceae bacterium]
MGAIGLVLAFFAVLWVGLLAEDALVFVAGESYMRIVGLFYVFQGVGLSLYFASQDAGTVTWPVIVTSVRFVISVGGASAAVLVFGDGLEQVFYFTAGGMLIYGVMNAMLVSRGAWRPWPPPCGFQGTQSALGGYRVGIVVTAVSPLRVSCGARLILLPVFELLVQRQLLVQQRQVP